MYSDANLERRVYATLFMELRWATSLGQASAPASAKSIKTTPKDAASNSKRRKISSSDEKIIPERFVWNQYPFLQSLVHDSLPDIYRASILGVGEWAHDPSQLKESIVQRLFQIVREHGYRFDQAVNRVVLRDRLRGYYNIVLHKEKQWVRRLYETETVDPALIEIIQRVGDEYKMQGTQSGLTKGRGSVMGKKPLARNHVEESVRTKKVAVPLSRRKQFAGSGGRDSGARTSRESQKRHQEDDSMHDDIITNKTQAVAVPADETIRKQLFCDTWRNRAINPTEGSYEWHVGERLKQFTLPEWTLTAFRTNPSHSTTTASAATSIGSGDGCIAFDEDFDMVAMRTLVRIRLVAGLFRSAIRACHDILCQKYEEAHKLYGKLDEALSSLDADMKKHFLTTRAQLAASWCLYSIIIFQMGSISAPSPSNSGRCSLSNSPSVTGSRHSSTVSSDEWRRYALATLSAITACPLVGNHELIAVTMSQFLVSSQSSVNSAIASNNTNLLAVEQALNTCHDGMRRAQRRIQNNDYNPIALKDVDYRRMAQHRLPIHPLKEEVWSVNDLNASFQRVMTNLPRIFSPRDATYYWVSSATEEDRVLICSELDRLHRLRSLLCLPSNTGHERRSPTKNTVAMTPVANKTAPTASTTVTNPLSTPVSIHGASSIMHPAQQQQQQQQSLPSGMNISRSSICDFKKVCKLCWATFDVPTDETEEDCCLKCRKLALQAWAQERLSD